jgi:PAS domain S-box-containing protein
MHPGRLRDEGDEMDVVRAAPDAASRQGAVLEAVAFAAERLLLAADWRTAADEVLARLGLAAGVSRSYVIEVRADTGEGGLGTIRHEWRTPSLRSADEAPEAATQEAMPPRWAALHARGESIDGRVDDLPAPERPWLAARGVRAVAEHPIFVGDEWWGAIGFHDCERDRAWASELDALRAAATVIGAAITRQRIEGERRRAERRWRQVIEHIPAVTYTDVVAGPEDVRMEFVSPQIRTVLGYDPERFLDDPGFWFSLIHPDDLARLESSGVLEATDVGTFDEVYRMRGADGIDRWIHDTSTPVFRDDGSLDHFLGFMIDITERMRAQELVREAEERYRLLVERTPAVTYTAAIVDAYDPGSVTAYLSPQIEGLLGYPLGSWQRPGFWREVLHGDDLGAVMAERERTDASGEPYRQEYRMIAADGRVVWIHDESVVVWDAQGGSGYRQGVMLDISDRKESQAHLERALDVEREAAQRLRSLDEMKNTFLQAVSHDLRTPLAAILGLAVTLERGDVALDEADARDLAGRIAANARRLERLVTNLLDMDRLARGIVSPQLDETDVGALVGRVAVESELVPHDRLVTELADVVQPIDAAKVERIVENLLANAVRHASADATVWVRVEPAPAGVVIAVEDDGPGVPEELRETIFEPFRQGPDAPRHSPGVGVGLTLVRRFAELQGGRAWVQERQGGGASFRVFVPSEPLEAVPPAGSLPLGQGALGLLPADPPTAEDSLGGVKPRR